MKEPRAALGKMPRLANSLVVGGEIVGGNFTVKNVDSLDAGYGLTSA